MRCGTIVLACLIAALGAVPSCAGDGAARKILGFSPDGTRFAFVQSGSQDGSGFPYADVFVIDTGTDTIASEPVHVVLQSEDLTPAKAEAEALRRVQPALAAARIGSKSTRIGAVAGSRPGDELQPPEAMKAEEIAASTMALSAPDLGEAATLSLARTTFDEPRCRGILAPDRTAGFTLTLNRRGQPPRILHKDTRIPDSRNCPRKYGLSEAYLFASSNRPPVVAVLVEIFTQGFEGADRRFLAVTAQMAK